MPAPTFSDGADSGMAKIGLPSIPLLVLVAFVQEFVDPIAAGIIYVACVAWFSIEVASNAKHWNPQYTMGYVLMGGFMWFLLPGVVSSLLHPIFGFIGAAVVFTTILVLAWEGGRKW